MTARTHGVRPELADTAELVAVDDLRFYPGNARLHDDDLLMESLATHGQYKALTVQRSTSYVLAGNGTLHAAHALGWTHVAVSWLDCDDHQARKIVAVDNAASDRARNDEAALAELLGGLAGDYVGSGFDQPDLDRLLASLDTPLQLDLPGGGSEGLNLSDRFGIPPFTVLDARRGWWRERKREWLGLGIQSELGRDTPVGVAVNPGGATPQNLHGQDAERYGRRRTLGTGEPSEPDTAAVSIFDPVLCELVYRWYSAEGHRVLDPWAGGSVRGVVAAHLGRRYTGVELRPEQVAANRAQLGLCPPAHRPTWVEGESAQELRLMEKECADLLFGCPPYYSLERYSDDPRDLSTMTPDQFDQAYATNIAEAARCLTPNSFAVWVVGNVRHPSGRLMDLGGLTVRACEAAGLRFYNDAILVTPAGSLPVRAGRQFERSRVMGRTHQQVLVFYKGDRKKAADRCGAVQVTEALEAAASDDLETE